MMIDSLMAVSRALYCCTDAHLADGAVLGSGEAGEEAGFSALISSLAGKTAPKERNRALCEFARLGQQLASSSAIYARAKKSAIGLHGLIYNHLQRAQQRRWAEAHLSAAAVRTRASATSRTTGSTMNDVCPPSGEPGCSSLSTSIRVRDRVPRVPKSRPNILKFIDFGQATISHNFGQAPKKGRARATEIGCVAACPCHPAAKPDDLVALNRAERPIDQQLMVKAGVLAAAFISQLRGNIPADAVTPIPCGRSRRPDCFGEGLASASWARGSTGMRADYRGAMPAARLVEDRFR